MQEVTDPELLKQLNSAGGHEVTDPELLKQLNGEQEGPGALKSAALGLMSGIPGAEAALSGLRSIDPSTTYEQAHKGLEADRDAAWNAHPTAYGAGKTAGIVGTGALAAATAPVSIPGALAAGAITGAASGLDSAERPADMLADAAKGGAIGAATGGVLQGAGNLVSKVLPAVGKSAVASLGAPTRADVDAYIANPKIVDLTKTEVANKLAGTVSDLSGETGKMSEAARGLINPSSTPLSVSTDADTLKPIFEQLKSRFLQNGVPKSANAESAIKALDDQYGRLQQIAQANGGKLGEQDLKDQIVELQKVAKNTFGEGNDVTASKGALRDASGALNKELKTANPAYSDAMGPVAERTGLISDIADKFNLEKTSQGYKPTDATLGKINKLVGDNKPESQEYLEHLKDLTGIDYLDFAKQLETAKRFNDPTASQGTNVLAHSAGYGLGAMTGLPGGRLLGSLMGGLVGHNVDGGRMAKSILDTYIKYRGSSTNAALQKYGGILANAAKQGGNQLAATHFVLSTSDPEYQKLTNEHQEAALSNDEAPQ